MIFMNETSSAAAVKNARERDDASMFFCSHRENTYTQLWAFSKLYERRAWDMLEPRPVHNTIDGIRA